MSHKRRVRLRLDGRYRFAKALAEFRARRDIESICRMFSGELS
ncbi:MAG: hypothetical protein JWN07_263 [Hyphomicrobiales bacterium]|nr:hypothetical protein [Hyphomicrobiales bacterium]